MIRVRQLAHVCILSTDLEKTRAFYVDTLGLKILFNFLRDDKVFGFYLDAGSRTHIEVFHRDAAPAAGSIDHLCLEVEDIDDAISILEGKGITPTRGKKRGVDGTWQCWLADPDGVKIELFQYTEQSAQFTGGDRVADW